MGEEYPDNCPSIGENDDAYKGKTKIAEVAAVTLCRLNGIMKQMRDWRDDRVKLRSNICRLKLALRVAGRETDDTLHGDPLIEHQRAEIKRLEAANRALKREIADVKTTLIEEGRVTPEDSWTFNDDHSIVKQEFFAETERLNNEILYLRSRLKEVEEGDEHSSEMEHLKCKLKHFMMVDHTVEIIFTDIVNKVAETIANLSEELVNVTGHLQMSKLNNDNLYLKIDKLQAMLRSKNSNAVDYQKRIVELENLSKRLESELSTLKDDSYGEFLNMNSDYQTHLGNAERLASDLKNKLKNDREALLGAGDPDCLNYMQRIAELRVNLKQLHVELSRSTVPLLSSGSEKTTVYNKCIKQISVLESTLKEINAEIDELKSDHVTRHCKLGGLEYLNKIEEVQTIVEEAMTTMNGLNRRTPGKPVDGKEIEKLKGSVGRVCREIKQLEVIVASNDCLSLFARIEQLEESIVLLKMESNEKDERANASRQRLFDLETVLEEKIEIAKDAEIKVAALTDENKTLKGRAKKMEGKISELQRELDATKGELEQLQQVRNEASLTRKKLQNVQADKESMLKVIGKMRDALQKRNDEFKFVTGEKDAMEKALNAKIADMGKSLQVVSKEKTRLLSKLADLQRAERKHTECPRNESPTPVDARLDQMKAELETSRARLNNANHEIIDLKARLNHLSSDKSKLETSISHLESKKDVLVYQLGVEKTTVDETRKELAKLMSDYGELNEERADFKYERKRLKAELTELKTETELLRKSLENINAKNAKLENEVDKYKDECYALREEIRNFETNAEDLASKLKNARGELSGAEDKIRQLESENSKHRCSLDALALKNAGLEGRVQVLLTEKNELATRINELDGKNVALRDQLNKVKTENEYSAIELDKLRTECDKARTENAFQSNALGETRKINEALKMKLSEIHSEYRVLENQLKIIEATNAVLRKEKETLYCEYVSSLRSEIPKAEKEEAAMVEEMIFNDHGEQIAERVTGKRERKWVNEKSDKRPTEKLKAKNARDGLKKLIVENEALKFELLNLRSQNFEIKMKLTRMREESQRRKIEYAQNEMNETAIVPIMNLYYKQINSYSSYTDDTVGVMACIDRSNICFGGSTSERKSGNEIERLMEVVDKMKIENVALKMEVNTLRYSIVVNFAEDEKRRSELRNASDEIQALKAELAKLRDEKESLRVRLDTAGTKLNQLESEKAALKDELYTLRKTNSDLKRKANELRCDYQKFKERSVEFESCVMGTVKKIKKYTMSAGNPNRIDDELRDLLMKLISNEELLHSMNEPGPNLAGICVDHVTT
ncbi:major antigen-like [Hylaeus volcanicus]|uniref:major antigen-like n=1 Tax=Hylaeus volcanicus TaxID=313075 RepID=UPI0023B83604|nr:major antigen-like [Hylaeus volcanicus]